MKKIAVFPGSFDPFTIGHEAIVIRALSIFDEIIIAVGANALKKSYFTLDSREEAIRSLFSKQPRISVDHYEGLTVDYCRRKNASYLLRGLRRAADFEFERAIAQVNRVLAPEIESVFLLTVPEHSHINSTIVRDIIRSGGDASMLLPKGLDMNMMKAEKE